MSAGHQLSMHLPTADSARQAILSASSSMSAALEHTRGGCTSAAEAFPGWATSAALRQVHAVHADAIAGHAAGLGAHADRLTAAVGLLRQSDEATGQAIAAALNTRA